VRKLASGALIAIGAGMLVMAAADYAGAALARDRVRAEWNAGEARRVAARARTTVDTRNPVDAGFGQPVARLEIPSIELDEIIVEGVGDELRAGPGHMPGTAWPGQRGNAVVSAHRDRHFRRLGELSVGDTVVTETIAGRTSWVVIGRRVVTAEARAIFPTTEPTLTLTTCWPIRFFGPAPDRLLIEAVAVKS
jgi:sortase A